VSSGEGHEHGSIRNGERGGARYQRRLLWSFGVVGGYFVVELVGGLLTNSLALLSDAGHMFTDVLGLGMAAAAIHAAGRAQSDRRHTFGMYRLEVLAALANAVLLFGVALYILYEALQRFQNPPEVLGLPMLVVAVLGLVVNIGVFLLLRKGAAESLNVEGAYLEVLADLFGSIGVIVAAIVIEVTGFRLVDPIFGVVIGLMVLPRTWKLGRMAVRVLLEAAPPSMDLDAMESALSGIQGVEAVHDLHVWTLTSGMEVGSVHLRVADGSRFAEVLKEAQTIMKERFHVDHPTVQIEPATAGPCDIDGSHAGVANGR
jgi:cobalt-zinc-cadmium efflux system protein